MQRTSDSTTRARTVLARLVRELGPRADQIVVIGGLAAPRLAAAPPIPHEGTTDVDLVLEVAMDYDLEEADYAWLEQALLRAGARPSRAGGTWRWTADGVFVDLLCDRYPNEHHGEVMLPGAPLTTAMQVPGPAAAAIGPQLVPVDPDDPASPLVRLADRGGYLLAKAGAAVARRLARDCYDFWWVVLHGDGGPEAAARAMLVPELGRHLRRQRQALMVLVNDALALGDGPQAYADTMSRLGSPEAPDVLQQDAVAAALVLRRHLITPS